MCTDFYLRSTCVSVVCVSLNLCTYSLSSFVGLRGGSFIPSMAVSTLQRRPGWPVCQIRCRRIRCGCNGSDKLYLSSQSITYMVYTLLYVLLQPRHSAPFGCNSSWERKPNSTSIPCSLKSERKTLTMADIDIYGDESDVRLSIFCVQWFPVAAAS